MKLDFRRRVKMDRQWPDALLLMAGAFRSGSNLDEALSLMVHESPQPLQSLLEKRWRLHQAWMPRERLIMHIFSEPELDLARAALLLAHEAGAGQSAILNTCANLLREKLDFKERVRIQTAQARFTAWVVGLSPCFLMGALEMVEPELLSPLFRTRPGLFLLSAVTAMVGIGLLLVHRMARIES